MNSRLYLLLFLVSIFILTAIGVVFYVGKANPIFWLAYIAVYLCGFALYLPFLERDAKLSWKKILLLVFSTTIIAMAVTSSVWTIMTPRWSFSVTTDKISYTLGENVEITVSLRNLGFITHSFRSRINDPVMVDIIPPGSLFGTIWYSPCHESITEFSIGPNESLEKVFVWNQTNIYNPEQEIELGRYRIYAFIPDADSTMPVVGLDNLFWAWTNINITST